jgi:two-component system, sensor histidine kinase and response regulator
MIKSIKKKLKLLFIIQATIVLCLTVACFGFYEYHKQKENTLSSLSNTSRLMSISLSDKISQNRADEIASTLSLLKTNPSVSYAMYLSKTPEMNRSYVKQGFSLLNELTLKNLFESGLLLNEGPNKTEHGLIYKQKLLDADNLELGSLILVDDLSLFKDRIKLFSFISISIMAVIIIISGFLAYSFQSRFTKPIFYLKKAIDHISKSKTYDVQLENIPNDEIGELMVGFNIMIREICKRDSDLEAYNEVLEKEVLNRTNELQKSNFKLSAYIEEADCARKKAEELSHTKSLFLANMSHEIRTPMNGVIGVIDLLNKTPLNQKQKEFVQIAKESSLTLVGIINDILDFSKIEAHQITFERIPINLSQVLESCSMPFATQAQSKGLNLYCKISIIQTREYLGDEVRIKQIVQNLVSNAIKFTSKGFVRIDANFEEVDTNFDLITIRIQDTGHGIDENNLKKIFDPFTQADNSTTRKFGGTGLGLSICKSLVELMNGSIEINSEVNEGTIVCVKFKLERTQNESKNRTISSDAPKIRALIIAEDFVEMEILSHYLKQLNIEVFHYPKISEAINAFNQEFFQLVILDQPISQYSSADLISCFKGINDATKSILLTRMTDSQLFEIKSLDATLTKPILPSSIYNIVEQLLGSNSKSLEKEGMVQIKNEWNKKLSGLKILVAEDYEINQQVVKLMLEQFGCEVTLAENGEQALKLYQQYDFDIIFMDCQMPVMDGFEATRRIRSLDKFSINKTPIVALTANVTQKDKDQCMHAGMDDFVTKPYSEQQLLKALEKWTSVNIQSFTQLTNQNNHDSIIVLDETIVAHLFKLASPEKSQEMLDFYISSTKGKIEQIMISLEREDYEEIQRIAHMLKSSSANFGATLMSKTFKELEDSIKNNKKEAVATICHQVEPIFSSTLEALKEFSS